MAMFIPFSIHFQYRSVSLPEASVLSKGPKFNMAWNSKTNPTEWRFRRCPGCPVLVRCCYPSAGTRYVVVCCGSLMMALLWLFGNIYGSFWDYNFQWLLCWIYWKGLRLKTSNNCCVPTLSDLFDLTETFHMFHHASTLSCLLCGWPNQWFPP